MGKIAILAFKPKAGNFELLKRLVLEHYDLLDQQGLVSARMPVVMHNSDDIIIEIFEWSSDEAAILADMNPVVQQIWQDFEEVAERIPMAQLPEVNDLCALFSPIN
ncbi:hypothetical protein [Thalassotalea aquiviva]|uniref:hypothetical protein n=1 Tax=Thalassotalea aquiviva TaxID=3242415 RepID=UPI00352A97A0